MYIFFSLQTLQDDGEFDDLYGNPPSSASSPAVRPKPPNNEAPDAQPVTPGGRTSTRSPAASSSVVSRSYARDRTGSSTSNTTDLAASGKQDKRRRKHGKPRRKGSQELFDVHWESDVKVAKCGLCKSDFSLVRRKHHCRHCGRVMCSDCSSFLYFEFSHRKHRVCGTCNNLLLVEQDAYDRETLTTTGGQQRDTTSNLFDDLSDDGQLSAAAVTPTLSNTPKFNVDDERARKKQEKKEKKERRERKTREKKWEDSAATRRESTEQKPKASQPCARGDQHMTMDELNPSYSSEDEPRMLVPTLTTAQPTFYDDDADKLVVDDSPGYFEATMAEREAQHIKEEEQRQQLASDMAWVNSPALPPTVQPHQFSSEQDSYSIVDHPSHTSNSPVGNQRGKDSDGNDSGASGKAKSGFTGALKRFFGMGSKKATTPPKPAKIPPVAVVVPPEKDITEHDTPPVPDTNHHDSTITTEPVSDGLLRHTVADYYGANRVESAPQETFRYTMAGHVASSDVHSRVEASLPSQVGEVNHHYEKQKSERKRRGTFDELFASPKNNIPVGDFADRYSTAGASGYAARVGESTNAGRASIGATAVGVARFDQRRSFDEAGEFVLRDEPRSVQPPIGSANDSTEAWRQSAAMSLIDDRKIAAQSEGSGFSWSNIRSVPGVGTATYAVPTSLQPRAVYEDDHGSSFQFDTPATQPAQLGNIMDDLKHGSTSKKSQGRESVDDFFAEFEEPNDYVIDPTTGGYVAARVPPRAAVTQHVSRSESPEWQTSHADQEKIAPRSSERDDYNSSHPIARPTALAAATKDSDGEGVEDDVAEIIVDKISSLESELAALKQLIRNRKGSGGNNQSYKPRVSRSAAMPSVRKESIFDNDSSDEENATPSDPYASAAPPMSKQKSKQRPDSKTKRVKERKDSFADLFEDNPNEKESLGGTTSYETLFQMGAELTQATSKEVDSSDDRIPSPTVTKTEFVAPASAESSISYALDLDETDEEEDFSINWSKMRKTKSRRHKSRGFSNIAGGSNATDSTTEDVLLDPSLLSESSDLKANDNPAVLDESPAAVSPTFLADASSNWTSVSTLDDEAVNLSLMGDEDFKSQSVNESKHMESTTEALATNETKSDDEEDVVPTPDSRNHAPIEDAAPKSNTNKVVSTGGRDDPVDNSPLPEVGFVEEPSDTKTKVAKEEDAGFDIFDESGDVDFLSVSSPMDLKTSDHEDDGGDSENDDKESLPRDDEAFSFEIQTPKKRPSGLDVPINIPSVPSVSERSESSPPSPASSADDNVVLGKYSTLSVPTSSRTPSVDDSLDDPEDVSTDDEPVLGKVESQVFDTDWQQMQAKEKERKKRLQVKQRQAQRDKVLRKQGVSTKSVSSSASTHGSNKSKSKSGKKKKKDKDKDDTASSSSHHKKSGSSRKHRQRESRDATDSAAVTPSEPPRSLTEL